MHFVMGDRCRVFWWCFACVLGVVWGVFGAVLVAFLKESLQGVVLGWSF